MNNKSKTSGTLAVQGSILAATSLLVRLIGFFYRIPLVNVLGEEGMGYYSSSFEIYSYILVISSYSMPSAMSKIISKKIALKQYKEAHRIFRGALLFGLMVGTLTSVLLYWQAANIASLVGSEGSVYAIKALAPSLLIFSILAVFRGYFQGHNTMVPTAISQVIEQVFNAIFSLSLAYVFLRQGLMFGAAGGTMGTGIGALFGLMFVVLIYGIARPRMHKKVLKDQSITNDTSIFSTWQIILMTAAPMLIGSSVYNLSNIVDMVMFQRGLLSHGYEGTYVSSQYGLLASKYRLILTLPISIASAMAAASIPSITASIVRKEYASVQKKAKMAIKMVMLISIPAAFGLTVLSKPVLMMLFGTTSLETASVLMRIGAVSIIFFSLSGISIGILQGLGKMNVPVIHSLLAIALKIVLMYILIYVMDTGLIGAVVANVVFSFIVAVLNYRSVQKAIKLSIDYKSVLLYPVLSAAVMSITSLMVYWVIYFLSRSNTIGTMVAIVIAIPIYGLVLIKSGAVEEDDIKMLPMGLRLIAILKKLRWMD